MLLISNDDTNERFYSSIYIYEKIKNKNEIKFLGKNNFNFGLDKKV